MALNIPMPDSPGSGFLKGVDTGSSMFSRMIQPALEREKQAQLERHFQEQLKLSKAAAARAGANSDLRRALLEQQVLAAQHANDPSYEFNQFKNLMGMMSGGAQTPQMPQEPMPTQEMGEGMGMFTPEGLGQMQQPQAPQTQPDNGMGLNFDALKQNPMLRGFFKKKFGFDPLATAPQTPEEKQAAALDLFKKKEAFKKGSTGDNVPLTTAMKTKLQGVVAGVDNSLPVIQELVNDFKNLPTGMETFNPSSYAAYNAKANSIIEPLINAFGLNVTDATKQMMHDQVFRKTNEPLPKYRDRLVDLAKEIIRRRDDSFKNLKAGAIDSKSQFTNEYFDSLKGETKELNGKKYRKIDGEWHEAE